MFTRGAASPPVEFGGLCCPPNYAERFRNDAWLRRCCWLGVTVGSIPFGIVWLLRVPLGRRVIGSWGRSGFVCRPDIALSLADAASVSLRCAHIGGWPL
jgi:hypothetical protein